MTGATANRRHGTLGPLDSPAAAKHKENFQMRDLTLTEIDDQLAEQLPSRELMGSCQKSCYDPCQPRCEASCNPCCDGGGIVTVSIRA
jgi:hypothetical protein